MLSTSCDFAADNYDSFARENSSVSDITNQNCRRIVGSQSILLHRPSFIPTIRYYSVSAHPTISLDLFRQSIKHRMATPFFPQFEELLEGDAIKISAVKGKLISII
jgi:hypothetical protein